MKKTIQIMLMVVMGVLLLPMALAEVDGRVMSSFNSDVGAELRFTQLEYAIAKNIITGEAALEYSNSQLAEEILVEMSALKTDVAEVNTSQSAEVLAEVFVAYKQEATNLTQAFRAEVSSNISESQRTNIKARSDRSVQAELSALNEERLEQRKEFNRQRVLAILQASNANETAIAAVNASFDNDIALRSNIRNTISAADSSVRASIAAEIREDRTRGEVLRERAQERAQERLAEIRARLHNRILNDNIAAEANIAGIADAEARIESSYENASEDEKEESLLSVRTSGRTRGSAETKNGTSADAETESTVRVNIGGSR